MKDHNYHMRQATIGNLKKIINRVLCDDDVYRKEINDLCLALVTMEYFEERNFIEGDTWDYLISDQLRHLAAVFESGKQLPNG